jgi:hypothetical protein
MDGVIMSAFTQALKIAQEKNERLGYGNNSKNWELKRYCSKINYKIENSFNVLFEYFKNNFNYKSIISYLDCRLYGTRPSYTILSENKFNFNKKLYCSYVYLNKEESYLYRYNRYGFTKTFFIETITNLGKVIENIEQLSEWELAQEAGFDRIWDCGTLKFEFINQNIII